MSRWDNYTEFQKAQAEERARQEALNMDVVRCKQCDSQWFEQISVARYPNQHNVILGQKVPVHKTSMEYHLLRCLRCGSLLEPRVQSDTRDPLKGDYDHLLDTLEAQAKEEEKKKEAVDAIQAQEL